MKGKLVLALALSVMCGVALAQTKEENSQGRGGKSESRPAPGIEDVLAADHETSGVLFLANPGKAQHFKFQNNHIICINCLGGSADTIGFRTISNPAHTKSHCISSKTC